MSFERQRFRQMVNNFSTEGKCLLHAVHDHFQQEINGKSKHQTKRITCVFSQTGGLAVR